MVWSSKSERNGNDIVNIEQQSQSLSGSGESSNNGSNAWTRRLQSSGSSHGSPDSGAQVSRKGKEKVDLTPLSSGSEMSLNEELRITLVVTLSLRKSRNVIKTLGGDASTARSTCGKYPIDRMRYDGFPAHHYAYMVKVVQVQEPTCFKEAVGKLEWDQAMDEEMAALDVNQTWDLAPLLEGKKSIGCKWVYKIKHNADGLVSRYKARLVAKGYA